MSDLVCLFPEELEAEMQSLGEPAYRGRQIFAWIHKKNAADFGAMTDLPLSLREKLSENVFLSPLETSARRISELDGTRKYVFRLPDGDAVESVWMPHAYGSSVCISSQVGCPMGCRFCASALNGLKRNLSAGEMLEQVYHMENDTGQRAAHVDVMGTGEPLENLGNLVRFIRLIAHPGGHRLSERSVTVSTCGVVPQIRLLAREHLKITLALSLHAPTDELRRALMPVANRWTIAETLAACEEYFTETGRRVSYEYALMRGVNDSDGQAAALAALLRGRNCHVNLIPLNPVKETRFAPPDADRVRRFQNLLEKYGINATMRKKMGADIDSACGQLRLRLKS